MCDKTLDRWGRLDYAHNNVGRAESRTTIVDLTEEFWDWVIDVSLKSVWLSMKYDIPHMLKSGGALSRAISTVGSPAPSMRLRATR